jgi:hypothetical protein
MLISYSASVTNEASKTLHNEIAQLLTCLRTTPLPSDYKCVQTAAILAEDIRATRIRVRKTAVQRSMSLRYAKLPYIFNFEVYNLVSRLTLVDFKHGDDGSWSCVINVEDQRIEARSEKGKASLTISDGAKPLEGSRSKGDFSQFCKDAGINGIPPYLALDVLLYALYTGPEKSRSEWSKAASQNWQEKLIIPKNALIELCY